MDNIILKKKDDINDKDPKYIFNFRHFVIKENGKFNDETIEIEGSKINSLEKSIPSILCPLIIEKSFVDKRN